MIDKKSRRVVIINNISSDTIDQAIFILKSDKTDVVSAKTDFSIVSEAQTIINNYIRQVEYLKSKPSGKTSKRKKPKGKFPAWLGFLFTAVLLFAVCYLLGQSA